VAALVDLFITSVALLMCVFIAAVAINVLWEVRKKRTRDPRERNGAAIPLAP
jgi:hypothetical protein